MKKYVLEFNCKEGGWEREEFTGEDKKEKAIACFNSLTTENLYNEIEDMLRSWYGNWGSYHPGTEKGRRNIRAQGIFGEYELREYDLDEFGEIIPIDKVGTPGNCLGSLYRSANDFIDRYHEKKESNDDED